MRVSPNGTEPVANGLIVQAAQRNGIAGTIRELRVILSLAGEIGIDLETSNNREI